ncbi:hypothetical protein [Streptantibioticus ferralitis]|uniref:Uncharacterized protein n=1 Tax=Streptantibioticus ferralitis TaxID=236510 RepID=A0ABT5Z0C4_9ACTN|nr:hypothetical protein [Streptantibioticus ferralitis]MDF2257154.1 hypothetical protein [Streptantibioticus ferralitis]
MTDEQDLARPRATPAQRARRPSFAQPEPTGAQHPMNELAPDLEEPWTKEDTDTPDRTATYTHPEGHRIGLRLMPGGLIVQTSITAGPDLPPIPAGTDEEKAEAQAANDARLQPSRSWNATVAIRHTDDLPAAIAAVLREQLIPALTRKPKCVATGPKPPAKAEREPKAPSQKAQRTTKTTRTTTKKDTAK